MHDFLGIHLNITIAANQDTELGEWAVLITAVIFMNEDELHI